MQTIFDTPEEMTVHLAALRAIAEADGVVTEDERRYLENLELIYKAHFPNLAVKREVIATGELAHLLATVAGHRNKMVFLQDLLSMASVDGTVSPEELAQIGNMARIIGIEKPVLDRLFELNDELLRANKKLAEFLFNN